MYYYRGKEISGWEVITKSRDRLDIIPDQQITSDFAGVIIRVNSKHLRVPSYFYRDIHIRQNPDEPNGCWTENASMAEKFYSYASAGRVIQELTTRGYRPSNGFVLSSLMASLEFFVFGSFEKMREDFDLNIDILPLSIGSAAMRAYPIRFSIKHTGTYNFSTLWQELYLLQASYNNGQGVSEVRDLGILLQNNKIEEAKVLAKEISFTNIPLVAEWVTKHGLA
jgi:hypothetical protein